MAMPIDMLTIESHPLLDARAFVTLFPQPLGALSSPPEVTNFFSLGASAPLKSDDAVREAVRALLRHGGFRPAGRAKPASEYLIKAALANTLTPINPCVDVCNVVSLHSGMPISVVDLERTREPLRVGVAPPGSAYVFNASGQTIELDGLLCLFDADGPCGSAVKDSQRTKTSAQTRRTLSVIWGTHALPGRAEAAAVWYRELLEALSAETTSV
jgi:DNA/RNA-binding domain of Phe-tRNA-synthetase-like protein